MARKNCKCKDLVRDDEKDFLLTDHHPQCPSFNPASELHGLEMQCRHFMEIITKLRGKVREMEEVIQTVDSY